MVTMIAQIPMGKLNMIVMIVRKFKINLRKSMKMNKKSVIRIPLRKMPILIMEVLMKIMLLKKIVKLKVKK